MEKNTDIWGQPDKITQGILQVCVTSIEANPVLIIKMLYEDKRNFKSYTTSVLLVYYLKYMKEMWRANLNMNQDSPATSDMKALVIKLREMRVVYTQKDQRDWDK